jgi:hypothetical protein
LNQFNGWQAASKPRLRFTFEAPVSPMQVEAGISAGPKL